MESSSRLHLSHQAAAPARDGCVSFPAIEEIGVSSLAVREMWYGAAESKARDTNAQVLKQFPLPLIIAPFDDRAREAYGQMQAALGK